jgi:hypothetical protein
MLAKSFTFSSNTEGAMNAEKRVAMYEFMATDALELVRGWSNKDAQKCVLVGLCLAVEMMLSNEPDPNSEHPSPFPTGVGA